MVLRDVPMFPLNIVLFPQMTMPLHIFEPRYLLMINECLKNNTPFGVVLLQEGEAEEARSRVEPVPYKIGTLAKVTEVVKLEDGRMLITTVGTERFRMLSSNKDKPYMTADIELWPDGASQESADQLLNLVIEVRTAFDAYLKVLQELAGRQVEGLEIPADPAVLSYLVPGWLQIGMPGKQRLLEIDSPGERLQEELGLLQRETEFLRLLKERADQEGRPDTEEQAQTDLGSSNQIRYNLGGRFSKN
jgi:Lon protease-like protein